MANFLPLAHIDTFELAGSLRQKLGLFRPVPSDPHGLRVCEVRGQKAGDEGRYVLRSHASKWVELTNLLQRIKRLGEQLGGIEYGRIDLALLAAGACMDWRIDRGEYAEMHEHAILMLRTSPAVALFSGAEVWVPAAGLLTLVSRRVPRSAINMGDSAAIWLAVDFQRKERPASMIDPSRGGAA